MDENTEQVRARVREARAALAATASHADPRALGDALDELEDALTLARDRGIDVDAETADHPTTTDPADTPGEGE